MQNYKIIFNNDILFHKKKVKSTIFYGFANDDDSFPNLYQNDFIEYH